MKIGVIKEIKDMESRVALTPSGAQDLIKLGHTILLEKNAGVGSGFTDAEYKSVGAKIVKTSPAWDTDLVLKIKEPQQEEYQYFKGNILFAYLHLSGVPTSLTKALLKAKTTAVAYETVEDNHGAFPILTPMSAIAGNMSALVGAYYLAKFNKGKGVQLGRVQSVRNGKVMVLGDGVVGQHAALTADGMGANVFLFGRTNNKFLKLQETAPNNIQFFGSNKNNISHHIRDADVVIGAVLLPGAKAPHLVSELLVKQMQHGSVIVDVSIDQGGCIETSKVTTHSDPVFVKHNILHYCVSNMPGAYPRTSTISLTRVTFPYINMLAGQGLKVLNKDKRFRKGVNTYQGFITYKPVAESLGLVSDYKDFLSIK
ncbi:MAG: alanine dehydrogenase [Gammaproteobacteria bacterium]